MLGVEIKVALADLKGDNKWPEYLDYCDLFYYAIPPDFPDEHVPQADPEKQSGLVDTLRPESRHVERVGHECVGED